MGFNDYAIDNLWQLLDEQRQATGTVPTDTTFIVERFRDELGDWRVILHSPYGLRVHGPLALAVGRRLRERYGIDEKPTASDDGIIVRLPDTEESAPGADLFVFDADEIDPIVTDEVGGSALFASRFRECAARALLLPRRHPGKRSPLWHQRQRAAQLLDVARKYPDFPIVLETVRECLQDVYDVPTLRDVMNRVAQRRIRLLEVETATPSPFAASLLFGYVGAFMYEGDSPLAERRAAALSLDSVLLAELLGRVELRELLDPQIIASTIAQLQHLTAERAARDAEGVADLLRLLGPLTEEEIAARSTADRRRRLARGPAGGQAGVDGVVRRRRRGGWPSRTSACCATGSASPFRSACPRASPSRWPTRSASCSAGTPAPTVRSPPATPPPGSALGCGSPPTCWAGWRSTASWCAASSSPPATANSGATPTCLKILRRRSLAALRAQVEPVSTAAYARFLPAWQQVGTAKVSGIDGLGRRDRTACGRAHSGVGGRTTGVRPAGPRLLSRPCSTSCWPQARSPGPAQGRSAATTAGSPFTPPTRRH